MKKNGRTVLIDIYYTVITVLLIRVRVLENRIADHFTWSSEPPQKTTLTAAAQPILFSAQNR